MIKEFRMNNIQSNTGLVFFLLKTDVFCTLSYFPAIKSPDVNKQMKKPQCVGFRIK